MRHSATLTALSRELVNAILQLGLNEVASREREHVLRTSG